MGENDGQYRNSPQTVYVCPIAQLHTFLLTTFSCFTRNQTSPAATESQEVTSSPCFEKIKGADGRSY
jgi:hypothetical protein